MKGGGTDQRSEIWNDNKDVDESVNSGARGRRIMSSSLKVDQILLNYVLKMERPAKKEVGVIASVGRWVVGSLGRFIYGCCRCCRSANTAGTTASACCGARSTSGTPPPTWSLWRIAGTDRESPPENATHEFDRFGLLVT